MQKCCRRIFVPASFTKYPVVEVVVDAAVKGCLSVPVVGERVSCSRERGAFLLSVPTCASFSFVLKKQSENVSTEKKN